MVNFNWQKYPVYKSSGVEWLGEIPEHWEMKRLKFISHLVYGDSLGSENREDGNINVYGSNGMIGLHSKANTLSPVIIVGRKGSFGKIQYSLFPCFCIDTAYLIDQRKTKQNLKWLCYALQILELDKISQDTGVPGLSREKAYQKLVPVSPLSEQQAIANFLDEKLAQIDEYIAKKQRIIELLKEQKTVIINQAVTKGINPDVSMKYSGIEWLGEVPEHWEVLPAFAVFKEQCVINRDLVEKNLLSLSYGKIIRKSFTNNFGLLPESFETYQIVTPGNIILRLTDLQNDKRSLRVGLVKEKGIITSAYLCLNPQNVIPEYVYTLLHIYDILKIFYSMGSGVRQNMKFKDLKRLPITFPPVSEQKEIVSFIEKKLEKIERSLTVIEKEIKLIQEYRTTLISETVTGKIDVRKYHPPQ
ncbi:restriction modification system DNA specificity domain [Trichodesmium erythraeum IMS101]|uniref:Restriction modification system DNA specificity domain n=1 Tax=Trichodesmium erythraeum (strain IMS101) TaxID=203124 RepID=Q10WB5_TRIEI|nr:restriction endonuclease subunit S [Trichodesmium erythraeum GBRTRLIN201]